MTVDMLDKLLSICIPSFNRPDQLNLLLDSIDCDLSDIEICICEDYSPRRQEIRSVVEKFIIQNPTIHINYYENLVNMGFDGNLRELVSRACGKYVMFMGDDDLFIPNSLDKYISFLKNDAKGCPYILRSYITQHPDGRTEHFRYLPQTKRLPSGVKSVAWLFKRSVNLCGFTISRADALRFASKDLDGTLLYQVYLMAQVCLVHESIYCDIPVAHAVQSFRLDRPMFGSSESERGRYTPGTISHDNSINFTQAYFEVTSYLDRINKINLTELVREELSKYSYPFLSIQRKRGVFSFLKYAGRLEREAGFGCTPYFFIYKWSLVILGEQRCDRLIDLIKKVLGHTPNF